LRHYQAAANYGCDAGVSRSLEVGAGLAVGVTVAVAVGVAVGVAVAVGMGVAVAVALGVGEGVGVGVGLTAAAQYLPPVLNRLKLYPPQTIISPPVQTQTAV